MTINKLYAQLSVKPEEKNTPITKEEGKFLYDFLKRKKIKKSLETGFAYGHSTAFIISATKSHHYAIDPFEAQYGNWGIKNIKKLKLNKYLKHLEEHSHSALPKLLAKGEKIDFAFIDGGHWFDDIFIDFYYIDLLLNKGGHVIFHDSWLRPTQITVNWILTNKSNYQQIKSPIENLVIFKKIGRDKRKGFHFNEFYNLEKASLIDSLRKKIALRTRLKKIFA